MRVIEHIHLKKKGHKLQIQTNTCSKEPKLQKRNDLQCQVDVLCHELCDNCEKNWMMLT